MSKIYTKKGDKGKTSMPFQSKISKNDSRCHAVGDLDELNTHLGLVSTFLDGDIKETLHDIQRNLLCIGSEAAKGVVESELDFDDMCSRLEALIDGMADDMPPLKNFILPGGTTQSATIHIARTVCRRCERSLVAIEYPVLYINRLSDFLFTLARYVGIQTGAEEIIWSRATTN